ERHTATDECEHVLAKPLVCQTLRRDQKDVNRVADNGVFRRLPLFAIVRVYRCRAHAHTFSGGDLVPHQRKQRGDEERGAVPSFSQQPGGDEVDEALAPSSLLDDQEPAAVLDDVPYALFLTLPEVGIW